MKCATSARETLAQRPPQAAPAPTRYIGFCAWPVRQCRRLHDRPFQWRRLDNGLLPFLIGEHVPKKERDKQPIVQWTQLSPRLTDAERGLPNDSTHSVNLHGRHDFPCGV